MSFDRRLGLAGLIVGLLGIAAFYLWPSEKWIGVTCFLVAAGLGIVWLWLETRRSEDEPMPSLSDALHASLTNVQRDTRTKAPLADAPDEERRVVFEGPSPSDPVLLLLKERQRLERELQPLLQVEQSGIKVLPAMKIGKDESDYRREKIAQLQRDIEEIGKRIEQQSRESARDVSTHSDWTQLADRFKEFHKSGIRAEHTRWSVDGREWWEISGGGNSGSCKSLCALAGAMLLKSAIPGGLSVKAKNSDDVSRWLFFLMENHLAARYVVHGVEEPLDGGRKNIITMQEIRELPRRSEEACLQCAAWQLTPH